ncbi:hypothetical protein [Salinigranum marinum]|uniref:hypothetical protein n=1 Tax=Salinigranum marinum TaxID=1515595 RepID=UPI002989EC08|nr:hypothetical protein [Salinigranum marinum]
MPGKTVVEFVEEWQTGFFVVLGVTLVGVVGGTVVWRFAGPPGFFLGFGVGVVLAFLVYSYLRYGR